MMKNDLGINSKVLIGLYLLVIIGLFFYSYTQVDLSLTLSRASLYQTIEKGFQYIGYFQRPLSASLFGILILFLYAFYGLYLWLAKRNRIDRKDVWVIIFFTTIILAFSYNAFSYDLFNYIFDAKIITHYHLNPYAHKALDFPGDPMLSFMHWTQRNYPYGPIWLFVTVPLSFVGGGYFLLTFFLFKFLAAGSYIGCVYFIDKISRKYFQKNAVFNTLFFALNPLVIVEFLISGHIDIFMIFLSLWSLYLLLERKNLRSILLLFASIGVKFATVFLLPFYLFTVFFRKIFDKFSIDKFFVGLYVAMIMPVILETLRTNYQPWYILLIMPFGAFVARKYFAFWPIVIFSFFSIIQYIPFLYQGDWNGAVPSILVGMQIAGIVLSIFVVAVIWWVKRLNAKSFAGID